MLASNPSQQVESDSRPLGNPLDSVKPDRALAKGEAGYRESSGCGSFFAAPFDPIRIRVEVKPYPPTPNPRRMPNGFTGRPGDSICPATGRLNLPASGLPLTPELS
jgi:hypothetical protein